MQPNIMEAKKMANYVLSILEDIEAKRAGPFMSMAIQHTKRLMIALLKIKNGDSDSQLIDGGSRVRSSGGVGAAFCTGQSSVRIDTYVDDGDNLTVMMSSYDITGVDELLTFRADRIPEVIEKLKKIQKQKDELR